MAEYIDNVWNIIHTKLGHDPASYIEQELIPRYGEKPYFRDQPEHIIHPLQDLLDNPHVVVIFPVHDEYIKKTTVTRLGDLFVGIYTREKITLTLTLGGRDISRPRILHPGEFMFPHDERYIIPLISMVSSEEVQIHSDDTDRHNVFLIYAHLDTDERRYMANNEFCCSEQNIRREIYTYGPRLRTYPELTSHTLPDSSAIMENLKETERKRRCVQLTQTIKKELMERTWHPDRFTSWCLEYDDEFFVYC